VFVSYFGTFNTTVLFSLFSLFNKPIAFSSEPRRLEQRLA